MKIGFDHNKYLEEQSKFIVERVNNYDKLYLEFGGKLFYDLHAKRVLPGFDENAKIKLLHKLKEKVEVIICVYARDIERNKIRGDFGITYDMDVLRLIDDLRTFELQVNSVVITRFDDQPATTVFINKLQQRGIKVYKHRATKGYPTEVDTIVSEEGYGKNPYIETTKPIVVVTAPGPGSGKLATCLSQLYHEDRRGKKAGYSKFETFPVWNVPLKHPLNIAYESATVDLQDVNLIDSFHLEAYDEIAINYNRDIEAFPVLKRIIEKITGKASEFNSPTDMGVNRVGYGIIDDEVVREASNQEIIRRYLKTGCEYKKGYADKKSLERAKLIMEEVNLKEEDRKVLVAARERLLKLDDSFNEKSTVAIELEDGKIITGKASETMCAPASAVLNAIKYCAGIDDTIHLISEEITKPIIELKMNNFRNKNTQLNCEEVLIALKICAVTDERAAKAINELSKLRGCQAHSTTILGKNDDQLMGKIGLEITCDPVFSSENLYYNGL